MAGGDGRPRAVAIGGGHGLSRSLRALVRTVPFTTAVVTTADDGGSSGRLRRDLDVIPPGDLRKALAAMSPRPDLSRLLEYRFERGELAGHSLGNLILVALEDLHGRDLVLALDEICDLLRVPGRVLPCTTEPVILHARTREREIAGQAQVARTPRVERVWLSPREPAATPAAVTAIEQADLIVLGPGSLFTSLIPNLLVPGVAAALTSSSAPVVFVANLREQPGETEGLSLADHLATLADHVPELRLSAVVAHRGPPPSGPGASLDPDLGALGDAAPHLVVADLLDGADGHDPALLARVLAELLPGRP